jgi:hypothetical protein
MSERKKFLLRISPSLWEELNRWAAQELRSVNGQIEFLLRKAVDEHLKGPARTPSDAGPDGHRDPETAP